MQRGSHDTPRWPQRLTLALVASLSLHGLVLMAPLHAPALPHINVLFNQSVELGLEEARTGAPTPPAVPTPSIEEPPEAPPPPPPPPRPRVTRPRAVAPPPPPPPEPEPTSMVMMPDAGSDDDVLYAMADVTGDGFDEQALAQLEDAGTDDASLLASADVLDASTTQGIPGFASAAGDLAAAVPQGSVLTFLLRMDRVRDNPQAPRVNALLMSIHNWRQVLDGTEIDPVRDLDTILLASANPFGTREHPPDFLAVVRTRAPRAFLRASVEQMTGARPPSITPPPPLDGDDAGVVSGPLRAHFESLDGGALPHASRAVWRRQGGAEIATIDRYWGPHAVMLLGGDLAVIAPPARVPALLAVLGARAHTASSRDRGRGGGRLVALFQAEGVRNLVVMPGRGDVLPRRLDLAIHETREGGAPDGGAELVAVLHYDHDAQAARVVPLFNALQQDLVDRVNEFASTLQGRFAAGSGAVRFGPLRSAIEALRARADGNTLRVEATLSADEVGELLNVRRLAAMFM